MANWTELKSSIAEVIKTNGNQEITGQLLQNVLNNIVSTVGENATFLGVARPSTNPGSHDGPVFYLASVPGVYSNFGGLTLTAGIWVLINTSGEWRTIHLFSCLQNLGPGTQYPVSQKVVTDNVNAINTRIDSINSLLGSGAIFAGVAIPTTNPGSPVGPVYYLTSTPGTYTNFGNLTLGTGIWILMNNESGTWRALNIFECLQELGDSTQYPMSQKAVSDILRYEKASYGNEAYTYVSNKTQGEQIHLTYNKTLTNGVYCTNLLNIPNGPFKLYNLFSDASVAPSYCVVDERLMVLYVKSGVSSAPIVPISLPNRAKYIIANSASNTAMVLSDKDSYLDTGISAVVALDIKNLIVKTDNINTNIANISNDIEGINTDIANVSTEISSINTDIDNVSAEISSINTEITSINSDIANVPDVINDHKKDLFIDMWNKACGSFGTYNAETGYFELNGLTDITYEQALDIYNEGYTKYPNPSTISHKCRTNILAPTNNGYIHDHWVCDLSRLALLATNLEVLRISDSNLVVQTNNTAGMLYRANKLKKIIGPLSLGWATNTNATNWASCEKLENLFMSYLKTDLALGYAPKLNLQSFQFLVANAINTSLITVTVHSDVYAKMTAIGSPIGDPADLNHFDTKNIVPIKNCVKTENGISITPSFDNIDFDVEFDIPTDLRSDTNESINPLISFDLNPDEDVISSMSINDGPAVDPYREGDDGRGRHYYRAQTYIKDGKFKVKFHFWMGSEESPVTISNFKLCFGDSTNYRYTPYVGDSDPANLNHFDTKNIVPIKNCTKTENGISIMPSYDPPEFDVEFDIPTDLQSDVNESINPLISFDLNPDEYVITSMSINGGPEFDPYRDGGDDGRGRYYCKAQTYIKDGKFKVKLHYSTNGDVVTISNFKLCFGDSTNYHYTPYVGEPSPSPYLPMNYLDTKNIIARNNVTKTENGVTLLTEHIDTWFDIPALSTQYINIYSGANVTLSFDVEGLAEGERIAFDINVTHSTHRIGVNKNGRNTFKLKLTADIAIPNGKNFLRFDDVSNTLTSPVTLSNFKLEFGDNDNPQYTPYVNRISDAEQESALWADLLNFAAAKQISFVAK